MLHKEKPDYNRNQYGFYTLDQLVPDEHFLRQVEAVIDFDFIYDLVEDTYSSDNGRPSLDPVILIKIPLIQCFYGIRSMRQTIKDIEVNTAYRWFLDVYKRQTQGWDYMSMYILVAFIYWLIAFLLERYQEFLENKLALV